MRFHLHYVAGRAEERLTFDLQPVVGARMGYTRHGRQDGVERFMRHYFLTAREVARLTRILEPAILRAALGPPAIAAETDPALLKCGFVLAEGKLMPRRRAAISTASRSQMLRILQVARDRNLELHPLAIRSLIQNERRAVELRGDPKAAALFMDLLCGKEPDHHRASQHPDGARWLSILNETGFLGRFIPDWARIVGQMQFDTYHVFTVDEHTIEAIARPEHAGARRTGGDRAGRLEPGRSPAVAPRAVSGDAAARHRQGPRRRPFGDRRRDRAEGRPRRSACRRRRPRRSPGWCCTICCCQPDRVQARHRRSEDHPRPRRHDPVAGAAAAAADPDGRRHARGVAPRSGTAGRRRCCASSTARVAEVLAGGLSTTERDVRVARARAGRRRAAVRLAEGGDRALHLTRLSGLLAVLRSRDPCPPRAAGARRRGAQGAADGGHAAAAGARGDRGHRLLRRPCRAVQPDLRRAGGGRRLDRRCAHPYPDQRHGARHVLDSGRRRRHVRRAAPAGAAGGADRAGAVGPASGWQPRSARSRSCCSGGACARSTCRRGW